VCYTTSGAHQGLEQFAGPGRCGRVACFLVPTKKYVLAQRTLLVYRMLTTDSKRLLYRMSITESVAEIFSDFSNPTIQDQAAGPFTALLASPDRRAT
jgi:hypothetical protein